MRALATQLRTRVRVHGCAMAGVNRGQVETARLRQNAEEQITRLMTQLEDLDMLREARCNAVWRARLLCCSAR